MVDKKRIDKVQWDLKTAAVFYIKNTTAKVDRPIDIWNCSSSLIIITVFWMQVQLVYFEQQYKFNSLSQILLKSSLHRTII